MTVRMDWMIRESRISVRPIEDRVTQVTERVGGLQPEQPYCRISDVVAKGIEQRQAASRQLKQLVAIDVPREISVGKEKLFIHPKLMQLLSRDGNLVVAYG